MANNLSCPVDLVTVHDKQPRIVAGLVAILTILFLGTHIWVIMLFLAVDFFLRAFKLGQYSPLGLLSSWLVRQLQLKGKPVDVAPKRFAAKLGFAFTLLIGASDLCLSATVANSIAAVLLFFALLESVLGYCVGCKFFQILRNIGWIK